MEIVVMLQPIRFITVSVMAFAVVAMAGFVPTPSSAAKGNIFMRVVNVAPNDVLNIRDRPNGKSQIIGMIPPNASGVEYLGQQVGNWLLVSFNNTEGWVHDKFVIAEVAGWTSGTKGLPYGRQGAAQGLFLCVLGSWRDKKNATDAFEEAEMRIQYKMDKSRLKFARDVVPGTTGIWYRVIIDEFYDKSTAQLVCNDFKTRPFSSFVQVNK